MKKFAIISLALAIMTGVWLEGEFVQFLGTLLFGQFILVPLLGFMLLWSAMAYAQEAWHPHFSSCWIFTGVLTVCVLLSAVIGYGVHEWRVRETRLYVERASRLFDEHHSRESRFPSRLPVEVLGSPPKWLQQTDSVQLEPLEFRFVY